MEIIRMRPLKIATAIMFVLSLGLIPFHPLAATLLMFSIICLWSRIPALISAFTKDLEVIDFFTVFIALNIGGVAGGIFGAANLLFSRLFGPLEWPYYTVKDAISIFAGGFLSPIVFVYTNDILITMYIFTLIRYALYLLLTVLIEFEALLLEVGICAISIFVAFASNTITVSVFGSVIDSVLQTGLQVNLTLIGFVAAIVILMSLSKILLVIEQRKGQILKGQGILNTLFSALGKERTKVAERTVIVYEPATGVREEPE
jgi:hypothetical protein